MKVEMYFRTKNFCKIINIIYYNQILLLLRIIKKN